MKVHLMYNDRDLDLEQEISATYSLLMADLDFDNVINTMSNGDDLIKSACKTVLSNPLKEISQIKYRQQIQQDVINNKELIKDLYKICKETGEEVRYSRYTLTSEWLSSIFSGAVGLITIYIKRFGEIRKIADKNIKKFNSQGFLQLLKMVQENFPDSYISQVQRTLADMNEGEGTLISAKFGSFLQGTSYTYRKNKNEKLNPKMKFAPSYTLPEMDSVSAEDLCYRCDKAKNETADILAKTAENFQNFFNTLKNELAFYVGCINLYEKINSINMPLCQPDFTGTAQNKDTTTSKDKDTVSAAAHNKDTAPDTATATDSHTRKWQGLYDLSLALLKNEKVTGNDNIIKEKKLCIITGANQGGKTTFLKSIGQAQLMAQCGMLVAAENFTAPVKNNIYTHFKKEEDTNMNSGKLDEEMSRMDKIVTAIKPGDMILSNESFSSTNEREGSQIFTQITNALMEENVEIFAVTHMCEYANSFTGNKNVEYLKAEHTEAGTLTYKMKPAMPSTTAFGEEIYRKVFGTAYP